MRPLRSIALPLLAFLVFAAMAKKPEFSVRFFTETNAQDSDRFSSPVTLKYPPRTTYIEKAPAVSERQVAGIYPFEAPDGTSGCVFKLDYDGRIALEAATTQRRGFAMVAFVGTKTGVHQVSEMMIDRPVLDGIITIQSGLTPLEVAALKKKFKPVFPQGMAPKKKKD